MKTLKLIFSLFALTVIYLIPLNMTTNYAVNTHSLTLNNDENFDGIENIDGDYENADKYAKDFGKDDDEELASGLNGQFHKYKMLVMFIFGIATLTLVGCFMVFLVALATSGGGNPQARSNAIKRLLFCAIGSAIMGSFTFIFGLAFNIFK